LIIFMFGCAAIVAFGVIGKITLEESPEAQAWVSYRSHLIDSLSAENIEIRSQLPNVKVVVVGSKSLLTRPVNEPAFHAEFLGDFFAIYRPNPVPEGIVVVSVSPGGGCTSERELWRTVIDLEAQKVEIENRLTAILGGRIALEIDQETIRIDVAERTDRETVARGARVAGELWGLEWEQVRLRCAGRVHRLRPDGSFFAYPKKENGSHIRRTPK